MIFFFSFRAYTATRADFIIAYNTVKTQQAQPQQSSPIAAQLTFQPLHQPAATALPQLASQPTPTAPQPTLMVPQPAPTAPPQPALMVPQPATIDISPASSHGSTTNSPASSHGSTTSSPASSDGSTTSSCRQLPSQL